MNVFLLILLLIVLYVVGFYMLIGLQAFMRWLSMFFKYLERGYLDIYKLYHSNKSIEDRDDCKYLYRDSCGAINEDYKKALENKSWILANLLDSASLSMRCHDLYYAKASLKFIEENKSLFQKAAFNKKEKKMLQNKWYRTLHYCWMLEEWKDIDFIGDYIFDMIKVSYREVPFDRYC